MVVEHTWLESPDIQGFRTGFKFSVAQLEPIENPDFLSLVMVRNLGGNKKKRLANYFQVPR
jgi:hypothetical protein